MNNYCLCLLIGCLLLAGTSHLSYSQPVRLVVMTDIGGDPDDQQSLVRLLIHADQFELEGLLTSSRLEHGQDTRPELIHQQIDAYALVFENLRKHARHFPAPDYLRSLVRAGSGDQQALGEGHNTPSSERLIEVVDKTDARPVWVTVWGGQRELAQALWKVQQTRSKADTETFVRKLRVHAIGNQDGHQRWIMENFPQLFFVSSGFVNYGYPYVPKVRETSAYRGMYMTGDESLTSREWVRDHIIENNGPLGALYPPGGGGVPGMKEGDSPAFLGLTANGLNVPERPEWGGFGGRFRLLRQHLYTDAADFREGVWNERLSVSRWRPYFQNDFAARMDWCVKEVSEANHAPKAVVNKQKGLDVLEIKAKAGDKVALSAEGSSDPDGNALNYRWWNYWEAGTYPGRIFLLNSESQNATLAIPADAQGTTLHVILEVTDTGVPALTSFRRVVIRVE
ncbi:DUF1593 domain-containing protein [Telluribacter sp.]|jgi:hypothetical protein|uniref:DUF1593 domain-containing protein n=1 Tax=Telluribacter sp. TaxID=1978767 RepID=UPI002E1174BD|nr:nucleoside hydrolase-like domain-containing protein [Telluribacter sp.]